jgi:hypothetical protein
MSLQAIVQDLRSYRGARIGTSTADAITIQLKAEGPIYHIEVAAQFDPDVKIAEPSEIYNLVRDFGGDYHMHLGAQRWSHPASAQNHVFHASFGRNYGGTPIAIPKTNKDKKVLKKMLQIMGVKYKTIKGRFIIHPGKFDPEKLVDAYESLSEDLLPHVESGTEHSQFSMVHDPGLKGKKINTLQLMLKSSEINWKKLDQTLARNGVNLEAYIF